MDGKKNNRGEKLSKVKLPKLIAIVGTNASGKSTIGLELAKKFSGEIISADSRQVYRGFDLCSGKVTQEESQLVPHHLIDIRDIGEPFSVADFQNLVYTLAPQIIQRERLPFIVGGTGLYISSIAYGYHLHEEVPNFTLREELEKLSIDELKDKLTCEGKAFFESKPADFLNKRRIIRVLEKSFSGEKLEYRNVPEFDVMQIGVTWPKEILHKRIEERLTTRIEQGMIDEVRIYLDNGGSQNFLYDLGLEYRYILWYLTGKFTTLDEFYFEMSRAIKRFAKKQITWFKRDKSIHWIDMTSDPIAQAEAEIIKFLRQIR